MKKLVLALILDTKKAIKCWFEGVCFLSNFNLMQHYDCLWAPCNACYWPLVQYHVMNFMLVNGCYAMCLNLFCVCTCQAMFNGNLVNRNIVNVTFILHWYEIIRRSLKTLDNKPSDTQKKLEHENPGELQSNLETSHSLGQWLVVRDERRTDHQPV